MASIMVAIHVATYCINFNASNVAATVCNMYGVIVCNCCHRKQYPDRSSRPENYCLDFSDACNFGGSLKPDTPLAGAGYLPRVILVIERVIGF